MKTKQQVIINNYDPNWIKLFDEVAESIQKTLLPLDIRLHHIGSTSIPGLAAKPIIDILGVVNDIEEIDILQQKLVDLQFIPRGEAGMPGRRFFRRASDISCHLHIFERENPQINRHLRFRDYMIAHSQEAQGYAELKQSLAKQFSTDIYHYCLGKNLFVKQIDQRALAWNKGFTYPHLYHPRKLTELSQIIAAMEDNRYFQWTCFSQYIPHQEIIGLKQATVVRSAITNDLFNFTLRARWPKEETDAGIDEVSNFYREASLPFCWQVGPLDNPEKLIPTLENKGFRLKQEGTLMYANIDNIDLPVNKQLKIELVKDSKGMLHFSQILIASGKQEMIAEQFYCKIPPILYHSPSPTEFYIGYIDGQPVTTGFLVLYAGVAGIYYIYTTPSYRKKGLATEMMGHLLKRAKELNYSIATLHASSAGKELYQKMGFQVCGMIQTYLYQPTLKSI